MHFPSTYPNSWFSRLRGPICGLTITRIIVLGATFWKLPNYVAASEQSNLQHQTYRPKSLIYRGCQQWGPAFKCSTHISGGSQRTTPQIVGSPSCIQKLTPGIPNSRQPLRIRGRGLCKPKALHSLKPRLIKPSKI